ncbi:MAG: hypothetical protein M5R36_22835 [Deltaproteobacteria bacterium]|nr:hypothetical protein [Deltaproteobacteria bacterium]
MNRRFGESRRGAINYVTIILLLILGGGIWAGVALGPAYMADWQFRREINGLMIKGKNISDYEIRQSIVKQAETLKIPFEGDAGLSIARYEDDITVSYNYTRTVKFPGVRKLEFKKTMKRKMKDVQKLIEKH